MACTASTINIESESEDETEFGVTEYHRKDQLSPIRRIMYCIVCSIIVILALSIVITVTLWSPRLKRNQQEDQQNEAFYKLQDLMANEDFNDEDDKLFDDAFRIFDTNNDGYLNETEFGNYFLIELEYSNAFERIDADKDNIISYPEAVVYVQALNEIPSIKANSLKTFQKAVKMKYGFEYLHNDASSFATFLEYVAILKYFESFDTDLNGYIHHNDFLNISLKQEFDAYHLNETGKINHDDFFDILYGNDENSWKGQLNDMFGDNYQETMNQVGAINITVDMVQNVEIKLSPIPILRKNAKTQGIKRRLVGRPAGSSSSTCWKKCWWEYDYGCACQVYTCTWKEGCYTN